MGSTNFLNKKVGAFRAKSGSSIGSDKEMNGKLRRAKIRRPSKMNDYGMKRIPDYTELAYKEAVSKLRYFLSGNYPPSIRSYGSPASIKNLDESDLDTADKKYMPSTYALTEYKPRPKLTSKYTTLYADSLKNFKPATNGTEPSGAKSDSLLTDSFPVTPNVIPTNDISSGTNPDVIHFIQKQEEYIEQLERESQYCRDELNNLLGKVKEVISENEHLHEAQKNKLITKMFHSYNGSETDDLDDIGDSTGLDSDHRVSPSKTRKSSKTRSIKLEGPNIVFESRISELEAQLAQSKIDLKKTQEENNENKRKLASGLVDSTCLDGFKRQIDNLQRDKSALETQISKLKFSLEQRDGDLEMKYKKGTDGVEQQLREERNNLEVELRRLKEELSKERSKVRELSGEGARRAIQERSAAEQRYNAHFDELSHDLAAQYDNVAKLQLDLERQRREENDLKREISMKNAALEEYKMELKNKSSSLQSDLAQANAERASLDEELASARLAMERHQRQAKHETNRLNSEIQSLRQRLDRADADLIHSRRENLRLSEQIAALEKELNMKNLTPMSPEKNKKEKELSTALESLENKHAHTVSELESMIQSQNSLMEKLTGECRLLTDKLDDANRRHMEELATLQRKVDNLGQSLQHTDLNTPASHFEAPTTNSNTNVRSNGNAEPTHSGQDHTRTDAPGDAKINRQHSNRNFSGNGINRDNNQTIDQNVDNTNTISQENNLEQNQYNPENYEEQDVTQGNYEAVDPNFQEQYNDNYQPSQFENYDQNYDPNVQNYEQPAQEFDPNTQNYEQPAQEFDTNTQHYEQPAQEFDPNTQNYEQPAQEFDPNTQNYEQPAQEFDPNTQNYEQPAQEFDPNTQNYDQNSQNYDPDNPNYDPNTQTYNQYDNYNPATFENEPNEPYESQYTPEVQPDINTEIVDPEKLRSNSPIKDTTYQS